MTLEDFSNEFDTLIGGYSSGLNFEIQFDEYEKSVFLTRALEEIVLSLYNGKNPYNDSFERTEELRRYLNNLIKTYKTSIKVNSYLGISSNSLFFLTPEDLLFITYEEAQITDITLECMNNSRVTVIPVTQDEYHKLKNNPFRMDNKKRVLRLDINNNIVELISKYNISEYLIRYLSKPSPIILTDFGEDISIDNVNVKTECKLNSVLHRAILNRAVQLAISSKAILSTGNNE